MVGKLAINHNWEKQIEMGAEVRTTCDFDYAQEAPPDVKGAINSGIFRGYVNENEVGTVIGYGDTNVYKVKFPLHPALYVHYDPHDPISSEIEAA